MARTVRERLSHGPDMWPGRGRPGHVARTARTCVARARTCGPARHVARTARTRPGRTRTCGPDGPDAARIMASARVDMFTLAGRGGLDGCRLKKCWELSWFFFVFQGGCPGCPGWVLCGKCRSCFVRAGCCVASAGVPLLAVRGWGGVRMADV